VLPDTIDQTRASNVERLSEGQRECLRLVWQYHSSKEVARKLGISPHTVDQRIKRAISILGVGNRAEAARLLMLQEGALGYVPTTEPVYDDLVYQNEVLYPSPQTANLTWPPQELGRLSGATDDALFDFQEQYFARREFEKSRPSIWSILVGDEYENNLSAGSRLLLIVGMAALTVFGFAALVSIAEGLSRFG
jgi:DNA-binding CsgD family transcriptional regulator